MDYKAGTPKNVLIANAIRDEIRSGRLLPGSRLAPMREIAARYNASKKVAELAFAQLAEDGLLLREVGRGTFVTENARALLQNPSTFTTTDTFPLFYDKSDANLARNPFYHFLIENLNDCLTREGVFLKRLRIATKDKTTVTLSDNALPLVRQTFTDPELPGMFLVVEATGTIQTEIRRRGCPYVFLGHRCRDMFCIDIDHEIAVYRAVRLLASRGCRRIGILNRSATHPAVKSARNAIVTLWRLPEPIECKIYNIESDPNCFAVIAEKCDGVYITDDYLAVDAAPTLATIPPEKIISLTNQGLPFALPYLRMEVDYRQMAAEALQLLRRQKAGEALTPGLIPIKPHLLDNTGAPLPEPPPIEGL